jgi:hypothetical protein
MREKFSKGLRAAITMGMVAFCAVISSNAYAQCGSPAPRIGVNESQHLSLVKPASFRLTTPSQTIPEGADIVGMWQFQFLVKGTVIVAGYTQWHSDGTEITNSNHPPSLGNFCLGVWKKTGPSTYKLNHRVLNFDLNGNLIGTGVIRELVTVDRGGNSYSGSFTLDTYDLQGHPTSHGEGEVTAQRITAD